MLMTLKKAEQVQEDWDNAMESHHICKAEAGMGAVSMGWDGYDGMTVYESYHPAPQPSEDPEYREAQAVLNMFGDLRVFEAGEFGSSFTNSVVVPEFFPYARDEIPF